MALALTALLASVTVFAVNDFDEQRQYDETLKTMSEIKAAILGRPDLYCNGWKQFTGYISDMGAPPALVDAEGHEVETGGQPRALWTRDLNNDGDTEDPGMDIGDECLWKYYGDVKIWAGWRGPYMEQPRGSVLRDGWGNPFMFVTGEVVTVKDVYGGGAYRSGVYRCIKNFAGIRHKDTQRPLPGFSCGSNVWDECWEPFPQGPVTDPPESYRTSSSDKEETFKYNVFYGREDALTLASFGADGEPGGIKLDQDIILTIYRTDWTGEVAGHAGYTGHRYVDQVCIYYPQYGARDFIQKKEISIGDDNDNGYGINFRFGTAPEIDDSCNPACDYENYKNFQNVTIPMGLRSIEAAGKIYVFTVEPTGNWVGTVRGR